VIVHAEMHHLAKPTKRLQVPGTPSYSLVLYYMANKRLQDIPLLESFVRGDKYYRNSRFKLCPHVAKVRCPQLLNAL
jgi:hypothetical protein